MKIARYIALSLLLAGTSCTDKFEEINTDPTAATTIGPNLLFTGALRSGTLDYTFYQIGQNLHADMYAQYFANLNPGFQTDRYESNPGWIASFWNAYYSNFIINTQEAIRLASQDPLAINKVAQARIWRAWLFHRVTDYWGDVPYSEAGKALNGTVRPKYDPQEEIYTDMLKELKEAADQLDPAQPVRYGSADILFNDNLDRWRKFANSLRLRLALRISNANPTLARQVVNEVMTQDNLISSNAEDARMVTMPAGQFINRNPLAILFNFKELAVSKTMVDLLTSLNDPRLPVYAAPVPETTPPVYRGLQNGLNAVQLGQTANAPANFSVMGEAIRAEGAPIDILTYPEVLFLKAEGALKGWGPGDAKRFYEEGIRASMNRRGITSATAIDAYLAQPAVAFDGTLEQIITQKWLALYPNGFEAWAEYRRTGFPRLLPIPNQGETAGQVPSRVRYPAAEQSLNKDNYDAAVSRQGPDVMTTKVWWDRRP